MAPESPRTALITGGAKRIGRAISKDLAAHGWRVAIHCRASRQEADALAQEIRADGGEAAVVVADLGELAEVEGLLGQAREALGPVSLLVNNAAVFLADTPETLDPQTWEKQFAVNLRAPLFLARHFAGARAAQGEGLIVNVIDQRVLHPSGEMISYTLSKSALWTATQTLAQALAPRIRVNAIGPGPTLPNSHEGEDGFQEEVEGTLLKRSVDLADFGRTIRYLWQAGSVTGQLIALDSGQHLVRG
ncbi:SDR family oxidoreductase [Afifella sp. IM 167]|uniref:SDR family oxidoreductase n=1 Tax=Afifella sp. IM 167 TaxID=2033586 RepID=UPI001CCD1DFB|nr:SDR family oxidoreductase [Afifella sp. IM 167]MBZ8134902.1 short chain dehydrogenase [Afifella sp. IM 167]